MSLEKLAGAVRHLFLIGRLALSDDSGPVQLAQVEFGPLDADGKAAGIYGKVPVLQHFGHASRPPSRAELLLAFLRGQPTGGVVIASTHQPSRLRDLGEGDSALYDVRGAYVWLKPTGLVIDAAGLDVTVQNAANVTLKAATKVRIEAPTLEVTGDVVANCDDTAISLQGVHDAYNAHHHTGVQTGSAVSGATDHALP